MFQGEALGLQAMYGAACTAAHAQIAARKACHSLQKFGLTPNCTSAATAAPDSCVEYPADTKTLRVPKVHHFGPLTSGPGGAHCTLSMHGVPPHVRAVPHSRSSPQAELCMGPLAGGTLRGSGSFIIMENLDMQGRPSMADLGAGLARMHLAEPAVRVYFHTTGLCSGMLYCGAGLARTPLLHATLLATHVMLCSPTRGQ